jgi:hypothetical protein
MSQFKKYLEIIQEFKQSNNIETLSTIAKPDGIYPSVDDSLSTMSQSDRIYPSVDRKTERDIFVYHYLPIDRKETSESRTNISSDLNVNYIKNNIQDFKEITDKQIINLLDKAFDPKDYLLNLYDFFVKSIFKNFIEKITGQKMLNLTENFTDHIDYIKGNKYEYYFIPLKQKDKDKFNTFIIRKKINKENM